MRAAFICLCVIFAVLFLTIGVIEIVWIVQFDRGCEGYLKRAADANTVELAKVELAKAVKYLESNKMTEGFTSVIYTTPDEDVGFLYKNLAQSLEELKALPSSATPLEKSNMLMKLRETILDEGKGTHVTLPEGISRFPYNTLCSVVTFISLFLAFVFGFFAGVADD